MSLRNGPPGLGIHVFPTDADATIQQAAQVGLKCVYRADNLPSILANKQDVLWSRIVLEKA